MKKLRDHQSDFISFWEEHEYVNQKENRFFIDNYKWKSYDDARGKVKESAKFFDMLVESIQHSFPYTKFDDIHPVIV